MGKTILGALVMGLILIVASPLAAPIFAVFGQLLLLGLLVLAIATAGTVAVFAFNFIGRLITWPLKGFQGFWD